jgi:hypothetical protein
MRKLIVLAPVLLAACSTVPAGAPLLAGSCSNDGLSAFAGQEATADIGAEIMRKSGAHVLRWIPNGSVVTMEFSADRVTIYLDPNNKIERVSCG